MAVQTSIFHQASILGCGAGGCTAGNAGQMGTCTTSVARAADEDAALNICKFKKQIWTQMQIGIFVLSNIILA